MSDTTIENRIQHPPGWRHSIVERNKPGCPPSYTVFGRHYTVYGAQATIMNPRGDSPSEAEIIAINALIAANRPWGLSFRSFENAADLMRSLVCPDVCHREVAQ